jgi:hypothetical protein
MRYMSRSLLASFLSAAIAFVSGSQPTSMQKVAVTGASPLKNHISPADANEYRSVRNARDWRNPYLMVQVDGVRLVNTAVETPTMSPTDVVAYLEKLPSMEWPYGLVVAVQENGVRASPDDAQIKRIREELLRLLEEAGIKVSLWPSA